VTVRNRRVRWALALAAGSAVLTLTAACGGSGGTGNSSGGGSTQAPGGQNSAMAAYADCLKQQGITMPTDRPSGRPGGRPSGAPSGAPAPGASGRPGGGGFGQKPAGVDDATWQKAQDACASVRPSGGPGGGGPGGGQGGNPAYANCLSDHGVPAGTASNSTDPKVTAAQEACKALSPSPN
jgi:hypothetical protein